MFESTGVCVSLMCVHVFHILELICIVRFDVIRSFVSQECVFDVSSSFSGIRARSTSKTSSRWSMIFDPSEITNLREMGMLKSMSVTAYSESSGATRGKGNLNSAEGNEGEVESAGWVMGPVSGLAAQSGFCATEEGTSVKGSFEVIGESSYCWPNIRDQDYIPDENCSADSVADNGRRLAWSTISLGEFDRSAFSWTQSPTLGWDATRPGIFCLSMNSVGGSLATATLGGSVGGYKIR